nr:hypothetical protein [Streptomyces roseifaciens]
MAEVGCWAGELESVFARMAGRFGRADLRWRMRDHARGLLGQAARRNSWQLTEWVGHRTPDGFQRLLNISVWDVDAVHLRDDVRAYAGESLGLGGVLILWRLRGQVPGREVADLRRVESALLPRHTDASDARSVLGRVSKARTGRAG